MKFNRAKIVALFLSIYVTGCTAEQASESASESCPEAAPLLRLLGTKAIFSVTPDEFIKSTTGILQVESDETDALAPGLILRRIEFKTSNEWLKQGEVIYQAADVIAQLDGAVFEINPSCYTSPEQFLTASAAAIGPDFKDDTAADETVIHRTWYWPDPDENYIRYISLFAGKNLYHVKVERDPAPQEGD